MAATIQPAVVGATGYAGLELTRLLRAHPFCRTPLLFTDRDAASDGDGTRVPGGIPIERLDWERLAQAGTDVLFLCTPHEVSRRVAPHAVARGHRVVDLSGAWRLREAANRAVYAFEDEDPAAAARLDESAAYGIPELHHDAVREAQLVASAGCYATSVILALAAWAGAGIVDLAQGVISDSKSGVSGAGKAPTERTHFVEVSNNLSTYSVFGHRHGGEIREQLGLTPAQLQFTPHLLPIPRGIMSTIYVRAAGGATGGDLAACLHDFHAGHPFVRFFNGAGLPEIRHSLHTNFCDLGFAMDPDSGRVVLVSCLDNLMKGAAGQAVQNMNVMFDFDERSGLS